MAHHPGHRVGVTAHHAITFTDGGDDGVDVVFAEGFLHHRAVVRMTDPAAVEAHQRATATDLFPRQTRGHQPTTGGDGDLDAHASDLVDRQRVTHR